jgi:hypothetical protein
MAQPPQRGIREKIGLDYLLGPPEPSSEGSAAPPPTTRRADASILAYAPRRILQVIKDLDTGSGVWLEKVADEAQMNDEVLLPLARRMEDTGLLEVLDQKFANDLVKIGKAGEEFLGTSNDRELVQLLGLG